MEHILKTLPVYWDAVLRGEKTFEVRRDDRGFQKGDTVALVRSDGKNTVYREDLPTDSRLPNCRYATESYVLKFRITYILTGGQLGIEPGYVVMGLVEL
jgi:hypothetical protein